mmetsp:Transcript_46520/g.101238  ORF Transcript_46520/g.101238 Transcript_46520/m.101238 type:complete len:232 (-) Transcript_46520:40-735(-)
MFRGFFEVQHRHAAIDLGRRQRHLRRAPRRAAAVGAHGRCHRETVCHASQEQGPKGGCGPAHGTFRMGRQRRHHQWWASLQQLQSFRLLHRRPASRRQEQLRRRDALQRRAEAFHHLQHHHDRFGCLIAQGQTEELTLLRSGCAQRKLRCAQGCLRDSVCQVLTQVGTTMSKVQNLFHTAGDHLRRRATHLAGEAKGGRGGAKAHGRSGFGNAKAPGDPLLPYRHSIQCHS